MLLAAVVLVVDYQAGSVEWMADGVAAVNNK
jgi:hypothetical protein